MESPHDYHNSFLSPEFREPDYGLLADRIESERRYSQFMMTEHMALGLTLECLSRGQKNMLDARVEFQGPLVVEKYAIFDSKLVPTDPTKVWIEVDSNGMHHELQGQLTARTVVDHVGAPQLVVIPGLVIHDLTTGTRVADIVRYAAPDIHDFFAVDSPATAQIARRLGWVSPESVREHFMDRDVTAMGILEEEQRKYTTHLEIIARWYGVLPPDPDQKTSLSQAETS